VHWIWSCRGCRTRHVEVSFLCLVSFFCPINSNTWWPVGVGRAARSSFRKPGLFRPKFQKPELARSGPAEGEAARAAPLRPLLCRTLHMMVDEKMVQSSFYSPVRQTMDVLVANPTMEQNWRIAVVLIRYWLHNKTSKNRKAVW